MPTITLPTVGEAAWGTKLNTAVAAVNTQVDTNTTAIGNKLDTSAAAEFIRDTMGAALVAGANVTLTVNDAGDTITIAAAGGGGSSAWGTITGTLSSQTDLQNALNNKQDTSTVAELIRDTMGTALVAGSNVTITPNDAGDTITIASTGGGGSGPDLFPRKSGQYYTTTHPLASTNIDANVFGTSGQRVFLIPFAVTHAHSVDRLAVSISTAGGAGSMVRMGIYPHSSSFGTVSKTISASVAANATGDQAATISQALAVGMYWLAVGTTDTTGNLIIRRAAGFGAGPLGGGITFSGEWAMRYDGVSLTTDLPATINLSGATTFATNDVPLVFVRKA